MAGHRKLRRDGVRTQPRGLLACRLPWLLTSSCLAGTCVVVSPAVAADWLGTVSADWFTAGNWNPAAVPGAATAVTINNAATPNPSTINAPGALAGRVDLGSAGGQSGTLNVAGGTLAATSLFAGILGTGTVNITGGGLLSTTGTATAADSPNSTGTITATGTNSRFNPGSLFVAADANTNGQVFITNGASLTTGGTTLGFFTSTASGSLTVSNATMTTGAMTIGERGNGTLNLTNGSTGSSTGSSVIGSSNATGVGTANIAGAGTAWTTGTLNIGTVGTGTLNVSSGAKVTSTSSNTVIPAVSLGGNATVAGAGSQWEIVGNSAGTSQGVVGIGSKTNSTGTLTVANGGKVTVRDGAGVTNGQFMQLRMGIATGSTGALAVTGANSSFITPYDVYVAFNAGTTGNITVRNGGALTTGYTQLGASGTGTALVTGAGSVWTVIDVPSVPGSQPQRLAIGNSAGSSGTLTIADGGVVNVNATGSLLVLGGAAGSTGTLNIGAAAASPAAAAGTLNAANVTFATGATAVVNFNHTSNNYLFAAGIGGGSGTVNFLSGTTILSGNNTYTGTTNISAGATGQFGNGGSNGLISGNVTNDGAMAVNLSSSATYAGVISGNGTFEKLGGNTLSLSGANTYAGATTISAGTLQIGAGGTTGSIAGNIVNNASLVFNRSNSFSFGNAISGTGNVTKFGAGTVTLTSANTYTGGTSVSQGTLQMGGSNRLDPTGSLFIFGGATFNLAGFSQTVGAFGGPGTAAIGAGSLTVGNDLDRTFQGNLTGSGAFIKQGTGSLAMSGNSSAYTGTTTVNNGLLTVNGDLSNSVTTVNSGGTLGGTGTVGRTTIGGTIAPGNSIGTLNVNGPYVQNAGSFYNVEVNAAGQSDLIRVNGTATINGGTVRVLAGLGAYNPTTVYTILSSTGARTGSYDAVTSNFAFLAPELSYDPNNVYLTLTRNSLDYAAIGNTPNQRAAGGGIELLGLASPLVLATLFLTPDQARTAFDLASGEIHPSLRTAMIEDSRLIREAVLGRLAQIASTPSLLPSTTADLVAEQADAALGYAGKRRRNADTGPRWPVRSGPPQPVYAAWAQGYGNWAQRDGDGNAAAMRYNTGGGFGGADVTLNNRWRFGFAAGGGSTRTSVAARASDGTIETAHMAVYGGTEVGAFAFKGGLAYARHDVTTTRSIAFGTFGDLARASYHGSTGQAFAEAAWRVPVTPLALETFVNAAYVRAATGSFAEAGGPAALRVAAASDAAAYTTLGARGSKVLAGAPWPVVAAASLGWQHAWTNSAPLSAMAFADSPGPFLISGVAAAADALAAEASADALIAPNAMLGVSYSGRVSGTASAHAARARFVYQF